MSKIPASNCPYCDEFLNGATSIEDKDAVPVSGDVSICIGCRRVVVFDDNQLLRKPTDEEEKTFLLDEELQATLYNLQRMQARRYLMSPRN